MALNLQTVLDNLTAMDTVYESSAVQPSTLGVLDDTIKSIASLYKALEISLEHQAVSAAYQILLNIQENVKSLVDYTSEAIADIDYSTTPKK